MCVLSVYSENLHINAGARTLTSASLIDFIAQVGQRWRIHLWPVLINVFDTFRMVQVMYPC